MSAGRRGNGEGTILKRSDGRWAAAIILDDYSRKWIYGKTRREVAGRLTKIQRDIAEGRPVVNERLAVAEYMNRWLYEVAKQRTRPMTWRGYEHLVRLHILPTLGRVRLAKLSPQHVHSLITRKTREGRLAPRTIQYMHSVLRAALNQAVRWRMIHYNAAAMVSAPRGTRQEPKVLTPEEARQLLDAARGDRLEALYSVALALGLRQGEALGLKWSDIDLDTGTLRVRRASQRIPHQGTQLVETKTDRSRRALVMPPIVISALRAHRARRPWSDSRLENTGSTRTWSSPAREAHSPTDRTSHTASIDCCSEPACRRCVFTTFVTLAPRCCSSKASIRES